MNVLAIVGENLEPYHDKRLLVAVSGGVDSVALLDMLLRLRAALNLELVVAHFDHGWRSSSAKDAEFVKKLAKDYSLPFVSKRARPSKKRSEDEARKARYTWLEEARLRKKADYIVTAHQADDQVETLLLHLSRGSGLAGLRGMDVENGKLIRPLLPIPRREIAKYVRKHKLKYRLDPTNRSLRYARNRIRHVVIKSLQKINPQLIETVSQSMEVFSDEYLLLRHIAREAFERVAENREGEVSLSVRRLNAESRALRHLVWREAFETLQGNLVGFHLRHVEDLDALLARAPGSQLHLPHGIVAVHEYGTVRLHRGEPIAPPSKQTLTIPGHIRFGDIEIGADRKEAPAESIRIDSRLIGDRLIVRSPKVGDRFKPSGMRGSKLISDLLTDQKVPRAERPFVPIITTEAGDIVWVAGFRADRRFAADSTQAHVTLSCGRR